VLGLWQVATNVGWLNPIIYGQPSGIWDAFREFMFSKQMWTNTVATMQAVFLAFVIGSGLGIIAGLLIGASKYVDSVIAPMLVPINTIPRIALAPLFVAWFGLTMTSKVVLAASIVFFILVENSRSAIKSLDGDVATMARVFGVRRSRFLRSVVLPSAVPTIFAGLRLGLTYALLGVIASEMIAARDGLGQLIVLYSAQLKINTVFAVLLELVLIATIISIIFAGIERWLLRWQD
jgi:NitT/TauT family transport system permease protein